MVRTRFYWLTSLLINKWTSRTSVQTSQYPRTAVVTARWWPLQDWSVRYSSEEPIQPRHEANAPDLYIPAMAFITYILVAGFLLGRQQRFSPEVLGMQASSATAWMIFEVLVILLTMYVLNTQTSLRTFDIIAFSGYKFVG